MAKRQSAFDTRLNEIVTDHVAELVQAITAAVRSNVASELSQYLSTNGPNGLKGRKGLARAKKRRILPCIAPGCKEASKGPRFHYLCAKHLTAPKKDYEAWRKTKQQQQDQVRA